MPKTVKLAHWFSITAPASTVVLERAEANVPLSVKAVNGFSQVVTLTCATGTPNLIGDVQPAILAGGAGSANLTIAIAEPYPAAAARSRSLVMLAGLFPPFILASLWLRRTRTKPTLALSLLLCTIAVGCGSPVIRPSLPASYLVTVTGKSPNTPGSIVHAVYVQAQIAGRSLR